MGLVSEFLIEDFGVFISLSSIMTPDAPLVARLHPASALEHSLISIPENEVSVKQFHESV